MALMSVGIQLSDLNSLMYLCNAVPIAPTCKIQTTDGALSISITAEMNVRAYVISYFDPSTPSTTIEVTRETAAGVDDWTIDIPQGGRYSVQVRVGKNGCDWKEIEGLLMCVLLQWLECVSTRGVNGRRLKVCEDAWIYLVL